MSTSLGTASLGTVSIHAPVGDVLSVLHLVDHRSQPDLLPEYLSLNVTGSDGSLYAYELRGELDIGGADYVFSMLCKAGGSVVVDLTQLKFIEAAGISALLTARKRIEQRGGRFELHGAAGLVRRVFEVVGEADVLET